MDPEFSREAAAVLNCRYWAENPPPGATPAEQDEFRDARWAEQDALRKALAVAGRYDDLPDDARAIYDRAKAVMDSLEADADLRERLYGE